MVGDGDRPVEDLRAAVVQGDELPMTFEGPVGEPVAAVAREVEPKPARIWRSRSVGQYISEAREVSTDVVEHAVEQDLQVAIVACLDEGGKIVLVPQPLVDPEVVNGIITVRHRHEDGSQHDAATAQAPNMVQPSQEPSKTSARWSAAHHVGIVVWSAGGSKGMQMVPDPAWQPRRRGPPHSESTTGLWHGFNSSTVNTSKTTSCHRGTIRRRLRGRVLLSSRSCRPLRPFGSRLHLLEEPEPIDTRLGPAIMAPTCLPKLPPRSTW